MLLETEGFVVQTAASRDEVLSIISDAALTPDLLITDYHLRSGETGLDIIDAVRQRVRNDLPVVLVSGDTSDRIVVSDLELTTFLKKPVDVDELLLAIRQQIGKVH